MSDSGGSAHTRAVERALTQPRAAATAYALADAYDEAFTAAAPRAHYSALVEALSHTDLAALRRSALTAAADQGMEFGGSADPRPFAVDPVPRIISSRESELLERGLGQRLRALNAFVADAYGPRAIVAAGRIPARVVETAVRREADATEIPAPARGHVAVAGFDIVRDAHGELLVLEDNLRTPSGLAYADCLGEIVEGALGAALPARRRAPHLVGLLAAALGAEPGSENGDAGCVLLSDGPANSAWWEHRWLAKRLAIPLVLPGDLVQRGGRVLARLGARGALQAVERIYRRTDESQLRDRSGALNWLGELLLEPLRQGTVSCANGFGTGIADDKLVHAYVEEMVSFYLDQEPAIRSVGTYDLGEPAVAAAVLERIDELVVKPRDGYGGEGVIVCPHAQRADRLRAAELVRERPAEVVAQETIQVSTHPTVIEAVLEPRHVDLRAFAFSTDAGAKVLPGGLTRVAFDPGALVVNSTQNGGGKATWMLR